MGVTLFLLGVASTLFVETIILIITANILSRRINHD
jgi:hypothetical protein